MLPQRFIIFGGVFAMALALLCSCTFPTRTGYDRNIGDYKPIPGAIDEKAATHSKKETPTDSSGQEANAKSTAHAQSRTTAGKAKAAATEKSKPQPPRSIGSLEKYASEWLGAKYVYGAAERNRTDCSGFVMQVYKGYYNIALDHHAASIYKDSRGKSISRGSLKEGDLIFFGSFWKIDHVGIYLSGDRFIHASSSKGVTISHMNEKYWSNKYQGARRFK